MGVHARSLGSVGRPFFGRPVAAVVAALIAMFAVGVPTAAAGELPDPVDAVPPPPVEPPPVEPPPVEPPPVEPPPVEPPPVEPAPAAPPPVEAPAAVPVPASPTPSPAAPSTGQPAATSPRGSDDPRPPERPSPESGDAEPKTERSVAENVNRVIQAVWQVQKGCQSHCYGTSQSQQSVQWSQTTQSAIAVSGGSTSGGSTAGGSAAGGPSAEARNEATTVQFVWQMQIGCVAFCFETSQSQDASQHAYTSQEAVAESALMAWAENLAATIQYVFQTQQGCEQECHGVSQSQSSTQFQSTTQSASATAGSGDWGVSGPTLAEDGSVLLPDWLIALALNFGATIQTVYQYQEALCLEHCTGDMQVQYAAQRAETDQRAVARAAPPPAPPEPPPTDPPPPTEQPPGPATAPDPGAPAAPTGAEPVSSAIGRLSLTLRKPRGRLDARVVRRQAPDRQLPAAGARGRRAVAGRPCPSRRELRPRGHRSHGVGRLPRGHRPAGRVRRSGMVRADAGAGGRRNRAHARRLERVVRHRAAGGGPCVHPALAPPAHASPASGRLTRAAFSGEFHDEQKDR